jgi:hypothetical protein
MSVLTEKGKRFYEEKLKAELEPAQNGRFVAIEPDSENYFVADTSLEAIKRGRAALPDKLFFLARIGFPTAHKFGMYGKRNR